MIVELTGLQAALSAPKLTFNLKWSVAAGHYKEQTTGGEPAIQVKMIMATMGDHVDRRSSSDRRPPAALGRRRQNQVRLETGEIAMKRKATQPAKLRAALGEVGTVHRLSRPRMGRTHPRRPPALRVSHPGRGAGRLELGDDPQEARKLPRGLRPVRPGRDCQVRREEAADPARRSGHRAEPLENRGGDPKCQGVPGGPEGVRHVRPVYLGFCRHRPRRNARKSMAEVPARQPSRTP